MKQIKAHLESKTCAQRTLRLISPTSVITNLKISVSKSTNLKISVSRSIKNTDQETLKTQIKKH